ncbi:Triosephosphate isomerase [Buchnera aphidicola (Tetraneura ulmi)]|uniref:triose-phosphate isomerase n=1 Tax=Buchnera aphidicola TaxID=9 RepID=UPI0034640E53
MTILTKKKIIIANWKLNGNLILIKNLLEKISLIPGYILKSIDLILLPPHVYLLEVKRNLFKKDEIYIGAQNIDKHFFGAYTGETSVLMLQDIGVKYVLIGHSERKKYHLESEKSISEKFKIVKSCNLIPILCIGETKKEKQLGQTEIICKKQIDEIFNLLEHKDETFNNSIIAYEPIWSIGTGQIPELKEINEIISFIKNYIKKKIFPKKVKNFFVIYGGSVNSNNVQRIFKKGGSDGLLVGAASLSHKDFSKIIYNSYYTNKKENI